MDVDPFPKLWVNTSYMKPEGSGRQGRDQEDNDPRRYNKGDGGREGRKDLGKEKVDLDLDEDDLLSLSEESTGER